MNLRPEKKEYVDPTVAEFLERHGIDKSDGMDVLDTIAQPDGTNTAVASDAEPQKTVGSTTVQQPVTPKRKAPVDTMRELRSVANAISVSISRSNLLREKLKEASRFLGLGFVSGLLALILALGTTSVRSVIFFSALSALVLGLISTYRSTMIMTKLSRIAKI